MNDKTTTSIEKSVKRTIKFYSTTFKISLVLFIILVAIFFG